MLDKHVVVGASVGVALFPEDARTAEELGKKADEALYQAKLSGRGVTRFYDKSLEEEFRARQRMETALAVAIRDNQLTLDYQPIIALDNGAVISFEALVRWHDPELGAVKPEIFVPLAEQRGLIGELGDWVLRQACLAAVNWKAPLKVSVNFSPMQFRQKGVAERVAAVLEESGLDPRRLEIEVTESVLLSDPEQTLRTFVALRRLGVRIVLDDFGTGYSSLSYFLTFPFDKVKIDRRFVRDIERHRAREIVRTIIDLAHNLRICVVAEGVETAEQRAALTDFGCDQLQGYLIGHPNAAVPAKHLIRRSPAIRAA